MSNLPEFEDIDLVFPEVAALVEGLAVVVLPEADDFLVGFILL